MKTENQKPKEEAKAVELKLSVTERLEIMGNFIPQKFDFLKGAIVKDLTDKLSFSQQEQDKIKMVQIPAIGQPGRFTTEWEKEKAPDKKIIFTKPEIEVLQHEVEAKNSGKQLSIGIYDIAKRIRDLV